MTREHIYQLQYDKLLPKFEELSTDSFIWLPLTSIPIDEHYPVNSMRQPALRIFNLLTWSAIAPLATDEQQFVQKLALEHEEMGYFLLHYRSIFGIIGVNADDTPGLAVIFNGTFVRHPKVDISEAPMLDLVYSKLKYPCENLVYAPGKFSHYDSVYRGYHTPECLDD